MATSVIRWYLNLNEKASFHTNHGFQDSGK